MGGEHHLKWVLLYWFHKTLSSLRVSLMSKVDGGVGYTWRVEEEDWDNLFFLKLFQWKIPVMLLPWIVSAVDSIISINVNSTGHRSSILFCKVQHSGNPSDHFGMIFAGTWLEYIWAVEQLQLMRNNPDISRWLSLENRYDNQFHSLFLGARIHWLAIDW